MAPTATEALVATFDATSSADVCCSWCAALSVATASMPRNENPSTSAISLGMDATFSTSVHVTAAI